MEQKLYFKHLVITSGDQDEVEREINGFNNKYAKVLTYSHE